MLRLIPFERRDHSIDWLGAGLLVAGVSCLLLALSWGGNEYAWGSGVIIGLFVAGAVLAVLFVLQEARAAEPILPLRLFRSATFALANSARLRHRSGDVRLDHLHPAVPADRQGRLADPKSGLLMLPMMAGIIITSILTGRAMTRIGRYKWFPVAGR